MRLPFNFGQSIPPGGFFASVTVGNSHACAIRADRTVTCWGAGTMDTGCSPDVLTFHCGQSQAPPGTFEQLALGNVHTCAMRADRTVQCWGWEGDGDGRTTPPAEFQ
jgi:alpha-tubulin suppressor-like RCC1 family protein